MNYSELQASVTNWAARSDSLTVAEVPNFISFTTAMFNHGQDGMAPAIRTREMETTTYINPVDGGYPLPADYLQYMTLRRGSEQTSRDIPIQISGGSAYPTSGNSYGSLYFTYYARIPELSNDNPSNWLLAKQPSLYLHGSLLQLAMFTKDDILFQRSAALVKNMIDGIMAEELMAKYSRPRVNIRGIIGNIYDSGDCSTDSGTSEDPDTGYSYLEIGVD